MRLPLFLVASIFFIVTPSFGQEWIEYSNRGDFFSVNLPTEPKIKDITYKSEYAITLPARAYTADDGPNHYRVTVADYSDAIKKHAEMTKSCKASGGDGDLCNDRSVTDLRGAVIYATWNLMKDAAKVTHLVYT